jgi:transposase
VAAPMPRIEIAGDRRGAHSAEFRAATVAQSLAPAIRIQDLARRNGICASLIYRWRREQSDSATPAHLVPVRIASESPPRIAPVAPPEWDFKSRAERDRSRSNLPAVRAPSLART